MRNAKPTASRRHTLWLGIAIGILIAFAGYFALAFYLAWELQ